MAANTATVILGAGIHCHLGQGIAACINALQQPPRAPQAYCNQVTSENLEIPYKLLAGHGSPTERPSLFDLTEAVARDALADAGLNASEQRRMALFVGSSSFDVSLSEQAFAAELAQRGDSALALRDPSFATLADELVTRLGIRGEDYSFNTACTASANALVTAHRQIEAGWIDHALVLGVELYNDVSALGFQSLGLLTRSVMKPFDDQRDGLVLGEGICAVVLGKAPAEGKAYVGLKGAANLSDNFGISAANPDGSTIAQVMQQALTNAGLAPGDIAAVKVHGTASLSNDESESAGLQQLFAPLPPLAALKPFIGHTLGACGLNELVLFCAALEAGFLVATPGISAVPGELGVQLNQQREANHGRFFMLNYFGFGGNNSSLIIERHSGVSA
jgi:3-oxoacyl-[acyl-carrier-protein] synthase-1